MAQVLRGYNLELFAKQKEAENYLCAICQQVFKYATSIGCNEDHIFCKGCLDEYFGIAPSKECPTCRQKALDKSGVEARRFTDRMVKTLTVKCELQHEQKDNNNDDDFKGCEWTGEVGKLYAHIHEECPLFIIQCEYCKKSNKRYTVKKHDEICLEKEILCIQNCKKFVKRKLMNDHVLYKCEMTKLSCDDCKVDILRKEVHTHKRMCPDSEIECEFGKYGCPDKKKRKLMANHLTQNETKHLNLKVSFLERQIEIPSIMLLLKSKNCYLCTVRSKTKQAIYIGPFTNESHYCFCIGRNIGFNKTKQIGFDAKDIDIIGNDVVFGVSPNKISTLSVKNRVCKTFQGGDIDINYFMPFYSKNYGLTIIGGEDASDKTIANKDIWSIQFNDKIFSKVSLTKLPYSAIDPSVCELNGGDDAKLIVCGGWWKNEILSTCCLYDFELKQWTDLKNMNHSHQCGGICVWKERGNKVIVAGGCDNEVDNKYVEEYNMHKNIWIDLPNLNEKHETYPALLTSNNILFCIGGVYAEDDNLGCIELYDPRDRANKWIYVDTVQNYFNIPKDGGAGFNCFLPI